MTSGVFFPSASARRPRAAPVRPRQARSTSCRPARGDGRRVDAEQSGDAAVAAPPALERFEAGEQPPLPLVEQAGEQHDGGAQLLRHQVGVGQRPPESGGGHQQPSGARSWWVCCAGSGAQ